MKKRLIVLVISLALLNVTAGAQVAAPHQWYRLPDQPFVEVYAARGADGRLYDVRAWRRVPVYVLPPWWNNPPGWPAPTPARRLPRFR